MALLRRAITRTFGRTSVPPPPPHGDASPDVVAVDVDDVRKGWPATAVANQLYRGDGETPLMMWGETCSLYDRVHPGDPSSIHRSGDPVADKYCGVVCGRIAWMALADGVNWGEKPALAAKSAVEGATDSIGQALRAHTSGHLPPAEIEQLLINAVLAGHDRIIQARGALTTLCAGLFAPLAHPSSRHPHEYLFICISVGDCKAFHWDHQTHAVKTITDEGLLRDRLSDCGGTLGFAYGDNPDLTGMRVYTVAAQPGDAIFLCSDGVHDNFDPEVSGLVPYPLKPPKQLSAAAPPQDSHGITEDLSTQQDRVAMKRYLSNLHFAKVFHGVSLPPTAEAFGRAILDEAIHTSAGMRDAIETAQLYEPCPPGTDPNEFARARTEREKTLAKLVAEKKLHGKVDHASVIIVHIPLLSTD